MDKHLEPLRSATMVVASQYNSALALRDAGLNIKATSEMTGLSLETVSALFDAACGEYAGALIESQERNEHLSAVYLICIH